MNKFILGGLFLICPAFASAQILISEVMYDVQGTDTDREWIEIQNTGTDSVDISQYKLFEANTNHSLTLSQGSATLEAGGFAIIADKPSSFLADNPNFVGNIFDSSFSLSNSGETISIKDSAGNVTDTVTYDPTIGAAGDGNSLQRINGGWKAGTPTPGKENQTSTSNSSQNNQQNSSTTQQTQDVVSTHYISNDISLTPASDSDVTLTASAGRNRLVAVGSPIQFSASTGGNASLNGAEFKWSLGDGFIAYGKAIEHMYSFAGDYVVVLTVSSGPKNAVHRINVKVINPQLSARHITGGIEIQNTGKDEVNIFKWLVSVGNISYNIPGDLIVLPSKSVALDALITKLPDEGDITMTNAEGKKINLNAYTDAPRNTPKPVVIKNQNKSSEINTASVANSDVLVIEHKGFFSKITDYIKHLFSSQ